MLRSAARDAVRSFHQYIGVHFRHTCEPEKLLRRALNWEHAGISCWKFWMQSGPRRWRSVDRQAARGARHTVRSTQPRLNEIRHFQVPPGSFFPNCAFSKSFVLRSENRFSRCNSFDFRVIMKNVGEGWGIAWFGFGRSGPGTCLTH